MSAKDFNHFIAAAECRASGAALDGVVDIHYFSLPM